MKHNHLFMATPSKQLSKPRTWISSHFCVFLACLLVRCHILLVLPAQCLSYLSSCTKSLLQHSGSVVAACGIQFFNQELDLGPLHWEYRVLDHQGSVPPLFLTEVNPFHHLRLIPPPQHLPQLQNCNELLPLLGSPSCLLTYLFINYFTEIIVTFFIII